MRVLLPLGIACLALTVVQFGGLAVQSLGGRGRVGALCESAGLLMLLMAVGAQIKVATADWDAARPGPTQRLVLVIVLLLFGVSCLTPAFYVDAGGKPASDLDFRIGSPIGLVLLLMGASGGWSPWVANLLLLPAISCLASRRYLIASLLGAVASLLALSSWLLDGRWLLGYYLWQCSFIALALGAALAAKVTTNGKQAR